MSRFAFPTAAEKRLALAAAYVLLLNLAATAQITPSPPAPLNTNATTDSWTDLYPQVAGDQNGNWVTVWLSDANIGGSGTDADILSAGSSDNGRNWSAPRLVNSYATVDTTFDEWPSIATDNAGHWITVWPSRENLNGAGTDYDIFVGRSSDNGAAWSPSALLNNPATSDSGTDFIPRIASDGAGNWVCVWQSDEPLNEAGTDWDIFVARSTDNGATWTPTAFLNTNAASDIGSDEMPMVAADGKGNWLCAWFSRENINGAGTDYDIFVSRSADAGATWAPPALLNTNATVDSGTDAAPQLATDGAGNWICVWESWENLNGAGTDGDIFVARSADHGVTWSSPAALNSNAITDTELDITPSIATDGAGNWVCVWQSNENIYGAGTDADVFFSHSTDNGATWTPPSPLNSNAAVDSRDDTNPQIAADRAGNWLAVWESNENAGGAGSDWDIFYTTFTLEPTLTSGMLTGVITSGGTPLTHAAVRAVNKVTGEVFSAGADPNGRYTLDLPEGRYSVTAYAPGMKPKSQLVTLTMGQSATLHFDLEPEIRLTGVRGVMTDEASGQPIVGARVSALYGEELLAETLTAADGSYEMRFAFPGKATALIAVVFEAEAYETQTIEVTVTDGQLYEQNTALIKAAGPGAASGHVRDNRTSQPIAGAVVTAKTPGYAGMTAVTNEQGVYLLINLQEGTYTMEASALGYITKRNRSVYIPAGGALQADLRLDPIGEAPELSVSPLDAWVTNKAQELDVVVMNLGGGIITWSAEITQGGEWLGISKATQGENNGKILVNFPENTAKTKREARVAITAAGLNTVEAALTQARAEDIDLDGATNAVDVQLAINGALDLATGWDCDIDGNGRIDSVDVQLAILAALE